MTPLDLYRLRCDRCGTTATATADASPDRWPIGSAMYEDTCEPGAMLRVTEHL